MNRKINLFIRIASISFIVYLSVSFNELLCKCIIIDDNKFQHFYVSTYGNDAWSGRIPEPNQNKTDGPFATLERARDQIRYQQKLHFIKTGNIVSVRGGNYTISKTFTLTSDDSGSDVAPNIYRAFPGENPVFNGAIKITNFSPFDHDILQTDLDLKKINKHEVCQVYYNNERMIQARYPNLDFGNKKTSGWAFVEGNLLPMYTELSSDLKTNRKIWLKSKDVKKWSHPEDGKVNIYPRYNYKNSIISINKYDENEHTILLNEDTPYDIRPGDRFYIIGMFEELDASNEWYFDKRKSKFYFWPPNNIKNPTVEIPNIDNIILIDNAKNIFIEGFEFKYCEESAIVLKRSKNCQIAGNNIHDIGGKCDYSSAIQLDKSENNSIFGNNIVNVGNYGIIIFGDQLNTDKLIPENNFIENNYFCNIGLMNGHGSGIYLNGVGNFILSNHIVDTSRAGIFIIGNDNEIKFNKIIKSNTDSQDSGGIYLCAGDEGWFRRGNIIENNYISDVLGFGLENGKFVTPYLSYGIYLDDAVSGTKVLGNIIIRCQNGGIMIHGGRDNYISNNIIVDGKMNQIVFYGADKGKTLEKGMIKQFILYNNKNEYKYKYKELRNLNVENGGMMENNSIVNNIFYYHGDNSSLFRIINFDHSKNKCDYNLIYNENNAINYQNCFPCIVKPFNDWLNHGNDTNSIIENPMFVDEKNGNYDLNVNSPAYDLGFKIIPIDKIGIYDHILRSSSH